MTLTGSWDNVSDIFASRCNGLELLGQLYFRYCPEALQEDIDSWEEMMWEYGTKTIAHDFFMGCGSRYASFNFRIYDADFF